MTLPEGLHGHMVMPQPQAKCSHAPIKPLNTLQAGAHNITSTRMLKHRHRLPLRERGE